jgi:hypothetical protein
LRIGAILGSSLVAPPGSLGVILPHALAFGAQSAEIVLGGGFSLVSGLAGPRDGLDIVLLNCASGQLGQLPCDNTRLPGLSLAALAGRWNISSQS